jgi:hypothetical protein
MRPAWITSKETLQARMAMPAQAPAPTPEAGMPAYMESFLAHLRLLVGVPFEYLVPDSRMLPDESIRFFYIDRSWTDRLVDGAISVGKIGTREQAHHQGNHPLVRQQLDVTERGVRDLQRQTISFLDLRANPRAGAAGTITGFVLRSGAVSGWPHMDVRAYTKVLPANYDPASKTATDAQLPLLRLERLSTGVLIALFEGIPQMVVCEEPHHGVQFGVHESGGVFSVFRRDGTAKAIGGTDITVPMRDVQRRVLGIAALRRKLKTDAALPAQTGSASFAIELLNLPWRQRFAGEGGKPKFTGTGAFVASVAIAPRVTQADIQAAYKDLGK